MDGGGTYSVVVRWVKTLLPVAALGLLSTIFLIARVPSGEISVPYAEIEEIARNPRISAPQISGMASDGSTVAAQAHAAVPTDEGLTAQRIDVTLQSTGGTVTHLSAAQGALDENSKTAAMTGLVRLDTSGGYRMETKGLNADLATGRVVSYGALEVRAPFGSLTAGQLIIETPKSSGQQEMIFKDGVRLIYERSNLTEENTP